MRPVRCESGHAKTEHVFGTPTFLAATQALVLSEQGVKCVALLDRIGPAPSCPDDAFDASSERGDLRELNQLETRTFRVNLKGLIEGAHGTY